LSFDLANGWRTAANYTVLNDAGGAVTFDVGQKEDLFDMRPSNYVQIAHDTQRFYITIDTGMSSDTTAEANFLAILGHNFDDCDAVIRLEHDDDSSFASATNVCATAGAPTEIINSASDTVISDVDPAYNGWTLFTWANNNTDNRYYRLTISDDNGTGVNFNEDVQIGCILMGEYIDFPNAPDLSVNFNVDYDGSKIVTSSGGHSFSASSHLGAPVWAATNPWVNTAEAGAEAYKMSKHFGRRSYDMNFSYVADTNMFLSNMHDGHGNTIDGSDLYSQFFLKTLGSHQPFLFTIDKDSTSEGDYGLFRLANGGLQSTQVAHRAWNTSLSLVEHW
jgi:hypothetical protein